MAHLDEVLTALDRSCGMEERYPLCTCASCRAARHSVYECQHCGYVGAPFVFPCDCQQEARRFRDATRLKLRRLRADPVALSHEEERLAADGHLKIGESFLDRLEHMIAIYHEKAIGGKCSPHDGERHCAHGCQECPVCGDGDLDNTGIDPWSMVKVARQYLRELRAEAGERQLRTLRRA